MARHKAEAMPTAGSQRMKRTFAAAAALTLVLTGIGTASFASDMPVGEGTDVTIQTGGIRTGLGVDDISTGETEGAIYGLYNRSKNVMPGDTAHKERPLAQCDIDGDGVANEECTCTVDADGVCTFKGFVDSNKKVVYAVAQQMVPAEGFNPPLISMTARGTAFRYVFPVAQTVEVGKDPVTKIREFNQAIPAYSDGEEAYDTSSGYYASSLKNPAIDRTCEGNGLKIAMVVDLSTSMVPNQATLTEAANGFVDSLKDTGSSIALFNFGGVNVPVKGTQNYPEPVTLDDAGVGVLKERLATYLAPKSGEATNWDQGLYQVAQAMDNGNDYDLVLMLTDGAPTRSLENGTEQGKGGSVTLFREVERATFSSNAIKDRGARVMAVGIDGRTTVPERNLQAISGPTAWTEGVDAAQVDYVNAKWEELANMLREYTGSLSCEATVNITKNAQAWGSDEPVASDGWTFTGEARDSAFVDGQAGADKVTSSDSGTPGTASWKIRMADPKALGSVAITEHQQEGWNLDDVTCQIVGSQATVAHEPGTTGVLVSGLNVGATVNCTFTNTQSDPNPAAPPQPEPGDDVQNAIVEDGHGNGDGDGDGDGDRDGEDIANGDASQSGDRGDGGEDGEDHQNVIVDNGEGEGQGEGTGGEGTGDEGTGGAGDQPDVPEIKVENVETLPLFIPDADVLDDTLDLVTDLENGDTGKEGVVDPNDTDTGGADVQVAGGDDQTDSNGLLLSRTTENTTASGSNSDQAASRASTRGGFQLARTGAQVVVIGGVAAGMIALGAFLMRRNRPEPTHKA